MPRPSITVDIQQSAVSKPQSKGMIIDFCSHEFHEESVEIISEKKSKNNHIL